MVQTISKVKYGVCNTSNVKSTRVGHAASVLAKAETGLENGMIVAVGDLAKGETDIREVGDPTKGGRIGIIASPEIFQHVPGRAEINGLQDFYIPQGKVADEYDLAVGDNFEISDNLITLDSGVSDLSKAKFLIPQANMKYKAVATLPPENKGIVLEVVKVRQAFKDLFYLNKLSKVQYQMVKVYVKSL